MANNSDQNGSNDNESREGIIAEGNKQGEVVQGTPEVPENPNIASGEQLDKSLLQDVSSVEPTESRILGLGDARPIERPRVEAERRRGARGTAAMDPKTRQEVARKGGLAVSRNRQHMAEIGRKGGQTVSKNREHMATIGRKGGEASRGHR